MLHKSHHKPHSNVELMMLSQGWNPRCAVIERELGRQRNSSPRQSFTCAFCLRLATFLRKAANRFEHFAAVNSPA